MSACVANFKFLSDLFWGLGQDKYVCKQEAWEKNQNQQCTLPTELSGCWFASWYQGNAELGFPTIVALFIGGILCCSYPIFSGASPLSRQSTTLLLIHPSKLFPGTAFTIICLSWILIAYRTASVNMDAGANIGMTVANSSDPHSPARRVGLLSSVITSNNANTISAFSKSGHFIVRIVYGWVRSWICFLLRFFFWPTTFCELTDSGICWWSREVWRCVCVCSVFNFFLLKIMNFCLISNNKKVSHEISESGYVCALFSILFRSQNATNIEFCRLSIVRLPLFPCDYHPDSRHSLLQVQGVSMNCFKMMVEPNVLSYF